jgi:hypothetical protein
VRRVTAAAHAPRLVAVTALGERLASLRLADASALAAMRGSLGIPSVKDRPTA